MNKEFIPYEEALTLKELGFNEPCLFAFDNCSTPMRCSDLRTNEQKFNGVNYNSSTYTSQPTFSQAFRWFREKYEYNIEIVWMTAVNFKYYETTSNCLIYFSCLSYSIYPLQVFYYNLVWSFINHYTNYL